MVMSRSERLCTKLPRAPVLRYYHLVDTHLLMTFHGTQGKGDFSRPYHTAEVFLNNVTSPYRDKYTLTPEYKLTAVRVERL